MTKFPKKILKLIDVLKFLGLWDSVLALLRGTTHAHSLGLIVLLNLCVAQGRLLTARAIESGKLFHPLELLSQLIDLIL